MAYRRVPGTAICRAGITGNGPAGLIVVDQRMLVAAENTSFPPVAEMLTAQLCQGVAEKVW